MTPTELLGWAAIVFSLTAYGILTGIVGGSIALRLWGGGPS